jgi:hypothetical protein
MDKLQKSVMASQAMDLRYKGKTWKEVRDILFKRGFKTSKGTPLSIATVNWAVISKNPTMRSYKTSRNKVITKNKTAPSVQHETQQTDNNRVTPLSEEILYKAICFEVVKLCKVRNLNTQTFAKYLTEL